jgi:hypothetical protein
VIFSEAALKKVLKVVLKSEGSRFSELYRAIAGCTVAVKGILKAPHTMVVGSKNREKR